MIEIVPAIIEDTFTEVQRKITLVAYYVDWVHIDIGDGMFVQHKTWMRVEDLNTFDERHGGIKSWRHGVNIDLHVMVEDPLSFVARAKNVPSIRRITFHYEAVIDHRRVIEEIRRIGCKVGLAINPETGVGELRKPPLVSPPKTSEGLGRFPVDAVLVMGVHPGWGGQRFIPETCDKIRALKAIMPKGIVGMDGGIHLATGTAQAAVDAGADYLVVGSEVFNASKPGEMIRKLQQLKPQHII